MCSAEPRVETAFDRRTDAQPDDYRIKPAHWLMLFVLVAAALWVRLLWTDSTSLNFDELMSLHLSAGHNFSVDELPRGVILSDVPDLVSLANARPIWAVPTALSGDVHPPFYYVTLRLWRELFGESALAIRSLSACFSAITVLMTAFAGRELAGTRCGLLAAAAIAFAASGVYYGQEVRMYAAATCLVPWLVGSILRVDRLGFTAWRGISIACATLALMLTLYLTLAICIAAGVYVVLSLRGRERRGAILSFVAAAVAFLIAWLPFMLRQDWSGPKSKWLNAEPKDDHIVQTLKEVIFAPLDQFGKLMYSDLWMGVVYSAALMLLPLLAMRRNRRILLPYLATLAAFGLPGVRDIVSTTNMAAYDRYFAIALPVQSLCIAASSLALLRGWPRLLPPLALMLYSVLTLQWTFQQPRYDLRGNARFAEKAMQESMPTTAPSTQRQLVLASDGVYGYNGGLLLAVQRYWESPPLNVVIVDSPADIDALPIEVSGHEIVMMGGPNTHPSNTYRRFAGVGRDTFSAGAGFVTVQRVHSFD